MKPQIDKSRRAVLKGIATIPVVALAGVHTSTYAAMLSVDDPTAKALGYVEASTQDGKACASCNLYQGGSAASGGCSIFPGKDVLASGYCNAYVPKP